MFVLAIVFYIACYHLVLFNRNRDVSYFYYGMYALLLFLAYSLNVRNNFYYQLIYSIHDQIYLLRYLFAGSYAIFYFKFSFNLVDVEKYTPKISRYLNITLYFFC